jgi:hypothetical protein
LWGLFISDEAVIALGRPYLKGYLFDTIFEGIHFSFSSCFCAAKNHLFFFRNLIAIVLVRIPFVYLASQAFRDGSCDCFGIPSFSPHLLLPVPPLGKGGTGNYKTEYQFGYYAALFRKFLKNFWKRAALFGEVCYNK